MMMVWFNVPLDAFVGHFGNDDLSIFNAQCLHHWKLQTWDCLYAASGMSLSLSIFKLQAPEYVTYCENSELKAHHSHSRSYTECTAGCLQLWKTWKTWKSQGICSFWKTQGKLGEFKIYSGNLSDAVFLWRNLSLGHQVVCIIVSNRA